MQNYFCRSVLCCSVALLFLTSLSFIYAKPTEASENVLSALCLDCHSGESAEAGFDVSSLGNRPLTNNLSKWLSVRDRVLAGEMPPDASSALSEREREELIKFLAEKFTDYRKATHPSKTLQPRRLNNREFENSVRDVLMIEDIGTHQPTDNLIGDSLHDGFDTHGETLGFSVFHLEQYIASVRKVIDATILSGERPKSKRIHINSTEILSAHTSQNTTRPERRGLPEGFDFRDPRQLAYFKKFDEAPLTGRYRITIRCTGKDRGLYDSEKTAIYDDDPIRLNVLLGNRVLEFDLPDEEILEIELDEWIAAGSRLRLQYPTDGLRLRSNGNFKFQNAITGEYLKEHNPDLYAEVVSNIPNTRLRNRKPESWHHWVDYWRGPRPRIFSAEIEGPFYDAWPPTRQTALLGNDPQVANARKILTPIARRAWRQEFDPTELDVILQLVREKANELGEIEALKEGIVAILVSRQFLFLNREDLTDEERFAEKFSYFLQSTIPDDDFKEAVKEGRLNTFEQVRSELQRQYDQGELKPFLREFPFAWLKLNDINFMAPDPDYFHHYHRKAVSEDMVKEATHFFQHAIEKNIPLPEFLSANYSFVNADLAKIYGLENVPQDSVFRRYEFTDGRRGGLMGMGAVLTVTADSLSTSPIHRAIYVMENFLGIHPTPPPADIEITEPDVREAVTIKETLNRHRSDSSCAACHQRIDPYGYAFENFDPSGAWRDVYEIAATGNESEPSGTRRKKAKVTTIPIDSSAEFTNGFTYQGIKEYRKHLSSSANRERFVRCFVSKLLTYANGTEPVPSDFSEIDKILAVSKQQNYRIVDTIAAVIDSPLFRGQ